MNTIPPSEFKKRTHALLEKLYFQAHHLGGNQYVHICPICFRDSSRGHAIDCELAFLYKESGHGNAEPS